jgi:urease gamma subunit
MTRDDFLVRCLKELQAFQTYSKTDSITAIQKIVKFINERLTFDQQNELKTMESEGLQLIALMVTNQIKPGQLNKLYDLIVKIARHQIDGDAFMNEVPTILNEILVQHF